MWNFLMAVRAHAFLQNAVWAALLAGIACGVVGTYVVVRRMTFISGGISHAVLGGMGIAYFLGKSPLSGAIVAALIAAAIIGVVTLHAGEHEDTLIGALWAVGMATGVVFLYKTPGYAVDLLSYLFGNILMVSRHDIAILFVLDAAIILTVSLCYKIFLALSFDEEFTWLQGVSVQFFYLLLLALIALTVVILVQVVGIVLVIALLTLPAAVAGQWTHRLGTMMVLAAGISVLETTAGLMVSYAPDLPSGATIVLLAGSVYLLSTVLGVYLRRRRRRGAGAG